MSELKSIDDFKRATEVQKRIPEEVVDAWNKGLKNMRLPSPSPKRVVDMYGRQEIDDHLMRFIQHSAAKGIKIDANKIIDWLYSEKAFDERDDFVKIERLMEMVGHGEVYPLLIMEVLNYAKNVEKAAIEVNDELGHMCDSFKSLENLRNALDVRLKVRESERQNQVVQPHQTFVSKFVNGLKQESPQ